MGPHRPSPAASAPGRTSTSSARAEGSGGVVPNRAAPLRRGRAACRSVGPAARLRLDLAEPGLGADRPFDSLREGLTPAFAGAGWPSRDAALGLVAFGVGDGVGQPCRDLVECLAHGLGFNGSHSSSFNPSIRRKSLPLRVISVASRAMACAAMRRSSVVRRS